LKPGWSKGASMSKYRWACIDRSRGACKEEFFSPAL
jgi:hypothetical protein